MLASVACSNVTFTMHALGRCQIADRYPHSPKKGYSPAYGFGTAPQRPDESKTDAAKTPGAIYDIPSELSAQSFSFAPMVGCDGIPMVVGLASSTACSVDAESAAE